MFILGVSCLVISLKLPRDCWSHYRESSVTLCPTSKGVRLLSGGSKARHLTFTEGWYPRRYVHRGEATSSAREVWLWM